MNSFEATAPYLHNATHFESLVDWGTQPDPVEGKSHSSGRLLFKGPGGSPESGVWVCTPGRWRLTLPRDEFCHFVAGRATYRSDTGEEIEVTPGTCVLFPAGWSGEAEVHDTLRNVYMIS